MSKSSDFTNGMFIVEVMIGNPSFEEEGIDFLRGLCSAEAPG